MNGPSSLEYVALKGAAQGRSGGYYRRLEAGSEEHKMYLAMVAKGWFSVGVNEWGGDRYTITEAGLLALRIEDSIRAGKVAGK